MPPSRASAIASRASVTVSIAAETTGMLSSIDRVSRVFLGLSSLHFPALVFQEASALIVEQFFHLNGVGSFIIQAAFSRDYAVVMTLTALVAVVVVFVNFLVDMLYVVLDPRIRRQRALA